jgi:hypothetical protein
MKLPATRPAPAASPHTPALRRALVSPTRMVLSSLFSVAPPALGTADATYFRHPHPGPPRARRSSPPINPHS